MKRLISAAVIAAMVLSMLLSVIPVSAVTPMVAAYKDVYEVGEPIMVAALSDNTSGKDWVGIAPKGIYTQTIAWDYLKDIGTDYDITNAGNKNTHSDIAPYSNFPAGTYVIYLIGNDMTLKKAVETNTVLASYEIEIVPAPERTLKIPSSVTYELDDATSGLADGTLTITLPEEHNADDIYMWWGNDNGKLEGYTRLARFKVPDKSTTEFTHEMTPNTLIPPEATKLMVYTYSDTLGQSEECFEVSLTEGSAYDIPTEELVAEFQVVSDIHISSNLHAKHFKDMLEDVVANSPNSLGIFAAGDVVDYGASGSQWNTLWALYDEVENAPFMYIGIGNHESYGFESFDQVLATFLKNLRLPEGYEKPEGTYYDVWVDDFHFIFLGDTQMPVGSVRATIGDEQYDWLEERLAMAEDDRPVFIFMHQSMKNTVSGSSEAEDWWGLMDDARLREILEKYPNAFLFNGHSHWTLDSDNCMYGGGDDAAIFNTASVGYLWHSYDKVGGEGLEGSQGYYVQVYKDRVLVRGRDFTTGEWVSSAQFVVADRNTEVNDEPATSALAALIADVEKLNADDYTEESWSAFSTAFENAKAALEADTQEAVDEAWLALSNAKKALVVKPEDEKDDEATEKPTEKATEKPTDKPTEPAETDPPLEDKGGCGSSFSALGVLLACTMGVAVMATKKRR